MAELLAPSGELQELDDNLTHEAIFKRGYKIPINNTHLKNGQVRMFDNEGNGFLSQPKDVQQNLLAGARLRNRGDDFNDFGSSLAAFGTGFADTLAPVAGRAMLQSAGVPVKDYEKYNSGAMASGQITAALASLFVPGDEEEAPAGMMNALKTLTTAPRAFARWGTKAGETIEGAILGTLGEGGIPTIAENAIANLGSQVAAKVAGSAVQGATEGSLYALSYVLGEKALGNPEDAAEGILAHVGATAMWTGALGAILGGAGVTFGRGLERLSEKAMPKLEELSQQYNQKLVGFTPSELERIGPEQAGRSIDRLFEHDILPGGRGNAAIIQDGLDKPAIAERFQKALDHHGNMIGDGFRQLEDLGAGFDISKVAQKLQDELDSRIAPGAVTPLETGATGELKSFVDTYANKEPISFAKPQSETGEQSGMDIWTKYRKRDTDSDVNAMRWHIGDEIRKEAVQQGLNFQAETGLGGQANAQIARSTPIYQDLVKMKKPFQRILNGTTDINEIQQSLNQSRGMLARAAFWGTHGVINPATMIGYSIGRVPGAVAAMGIKAALGAITPEVGTVANTLRRTVAQKYAVNKALQNALGSVQNRMDSSVDGIIGRLFSVGKRLNGQAAQPTAAIIQQHTGETDTRRAVKSFSDELDQLGGDPAQLVSKMQAGLAGISEHDPELTKQLIGKSTAVLGFLKQQMQGIIPPGDQLQPFRDSERQLPSLKDANEFARTFAIATHPMDVLENAAKFPLTPKDLATFRALYPRMATRVLFDLARTVANDPRPIPSQSRWEIARMIGGPVGPGTTPQFLLRSQASYQRQGNPAGGMQGPGNPSPSGTAISKRQARDEALAMAPGTQMVNRGLAGA